MSEFQPTTEPAPPPHREATPPQRGLLDRDWLQALVVSLTLLTSLALLWVLWQVLSPILHTLVLFALAGFFASEMVSRERQSLRVAGLVQQLLDADSRQVPEIIANLHGYRREAEPLLRKLML